MFIQSCWIVLSTCKINRILMRTTTFIQSCVCMVQRTWPFQNKIGQDGKISAYYRVHCYNARASASRKTTRLLDQIRFSITIFWILFHESCSYIIGIQYRKRRQCLRICNNYGGHKQSRNMRKRHFALPSTLLSLQFCLVLDFPFSLIGPSI